MSTDTNSRTTMNVRVGPRLSVAKSPLAAQGFSSFALRVHDASVERWGADKAVEIVGSSPAILEVQKKVEKIAPFHEPVLIAGESGVGKESLAQAIYLLSGRRSKPYVCVNCPQYRDSNLTVSELFGHKRGAFTGAVADRQGCFETANGGVIFLDEIGDLDMSAQVMLLRALAVGEFQPLGADYLRTVNVRVVAATNRPLHQLMVGEQFRHDLFFRLQYFMVNVPPLRERGDDWVLLLEYYLGRLYEKYGVRKQFSSASLKILQQYRWPGNVRELSSVATTGYALSDSDTIEPQDFVTILNDSNGTASTERPNDLYLRMTVDRESFWDVVYKPFMNRDLNRRQVTGVINHGLMQAGGSYRKMLESFSVTPGEYHKAMDFLRHHNLKP